MSGITNKKTISYIVPLSIMFKSDICKYYSILSMEGIGSFCKGEIIAAGVLLSYLKLTQCGTKPLLSMIKSET